MACIARRSDHIAAALWRRCRYREETPRGHARATELLHRRSIVQGVPARGAGLHAPARHLCSSSSLPPSEARRLSSPRASCRNKLTGVVLAQFVVTGLDLAVLPRRQTTRTAAVHRCPPGSHHHGSPRRGTSSFQLSACAPRPTALVQPPGTNSPAQERRRSTTSSQQTRHSPYP